MKISYSKRCKLIDLAQSKGSITSYPFLEAALNILYQGDDTKDTKDTKAKAKDTKDQLVKMCKAFFHILYQGDDINFHGTKFKDCTEDSKAQLVKMCEAFCHIARMRLKLAAQKLIVITGNSGKTTVLLERLWNINEGLSRGSHLLFFSIHHRVKVTAVDCPLDTIGKTAECYSIVPTLVIFPHRFHDYDSINYPVDEIATLLAFSSKSAEFRLLLCLIAADQDELQKAKNEFGDRPVKKMRQNCEAELYKALKERNIEMSPEKVSVLLTAEGAIIDGVEEIREKIHEWISDTK